LPENRNVEIVHTIGESDPTTQSDAS